MSWQISLPRLFCVEFSVTEFYVDWIHPQIGLDWTGWDDCDPV